MVTWSSDRLYIRRVEELNESNPVPCICRKFSKLFCALSRKNLIFLLPPSFVSFYEFFRSSFPVILRNLSYLSLFLLSKTNLKISLCLPKKCCQNIVGTQFSYGFLRARHPCCKSLHRLSLSFRSLSDLINSHRTIPSSKKICVKVMPKKVFTCLVFFHFRLFS